MTKPDKKGPGIYFAIGYGLQQITTTVSGIGNTSKTNGFIILGGIRI
jgi:hypothetical protein